MSDIDIAALIADAGTGMEGIATQKYGYTETRNKSAAFASGRFMAATQRYSGHWLTYIRGSDGKWWEYDSWWHSAPTLVGNDQALETILTNDNMTNMYYKS